MIKNQNIRLSVIIPCFNDGKFIREAIASVEACSSPVYEIIVVNDGSTDLLTKQVLDELKENGYQVIEQPNQGAAAARNAGIKNALGEYILPLDSDNRVRPSYIEKGIEILDRLPEVAVVYGDVEHFGEEICDPSQLPKFSVPYDTLSFTNGFRGVQKIPDFNLSWLINHNYIDMCAVIRKSVWKECGPYDTNMPFGCYDDWDLWLSIAKKGYRFYHVPEILFEYRVRPVSLSTTSRSDEKAKLVIQYLASKHAACFPREYRMYFTPYRYWIKIWHQIQSRLKLQLKDAAQNT